MLVLKLKTAVLVADPLKWAKTHVMCRHVLNLEDRYSIHGWWQMIPILIPTYMCGRHPSSVYFEGFLGGRSKLSLPFKFCSFDRLHTVVQNCATSKLRKFFIRQFLPESTRKYPFQPTHRGALSNNYVIVQTTPDRTPQYCSNIDLIQSKQRFPVRYWQTCVYSHN